MFPLETTVFAEKLLCKEVGFLFEFRILNIFLNLNGYKPLHKVLRRDLMVYILYKRELLFINNIGK